VCAVETLVTGSFGSKPAVASRTTAMSSTFLASGPPTSWVRASGMMPSRLNSPCVTRRPTRLLCDEGIRIEPHVSVPIPTTAKFAAIAAPVPPLDPPGLRRVSYGFSVCPPSELMVVIPYANSCMFVLPRKIAPASLNRRTRYPSSGGIDDSRERDEALVAMS
jgi:hypothetical protein